MTKHKKLTRSRDNRVIAGALGGIANYFNWDATLVRIIFVVLGFLPVLPGILVYIIAWVLIPDEPRQTHYYSDGSRKDVTPDDYDDRP
ncbi:MAG: PspC domain-containing protein [Leuconostoc mesenteroides]|uniref:PspC domain-containing protein n=1 Tax=Leuconostoc mesenteroides TaxID=1245 RepID=UPI0009FBF224|nr:PspC domain-containing protein [Leuconostoc mesenteroides]MCP9302852.1 PspC domain-containing protein [Leuconostoc mesenteroides]MCP9327199.1 PspC domain-containing protein [Leuconostoc mesenteroides]ORI79443.1 stress-responsive transcriptional regulator [Leuconostoc mesenteroides subsp. mesenteroides]